MTADTVSEQGLTRRIRCEECHVRYLRSLVEDPSSVDSELRRRENHIRELKASIEKHEAAIALIKSQRSRATELLKEADSKLKALKRQRARCLVNELILSYRATHSALKELSEC